ncbi:hypothetical protein ACP70R_016449 [Stipagrostis hirtigluma subsp. patula]
MEPAPPLPDDALAAILARLPPDTLAACRCVCRAWRSVVDARRLLLPHLLPHAVRGVFLNFIDYRRPGFFARPSSERPRIDGNLDFLPEYSSRFRPIRGHCNGLMLYGDSRELFVVNPATRRWERLPPRMDGSDYISYLVFDPAVSPHYQVFLIPRVPEKPEAVDPSRHAPQIGSSKKKKKKKDRPIGPREKRENPPTMFNVSSLFASLGDMSGDEDTEDQRGEEHVESSSARSVEEDDFPASLREPEIEDPSRLLEWPPSLCKLLVFSSNTGRWEERSFVRVGEAAETVEDVRQDLFRPMFWCPRWHYSVYWRGALYVHCHGAFIMRFTLTNGKYQVIKTPIDIEEVKHVRPYLGRSEMGIYFATLPEKYSYLLRVWILDESCGHVDWVLKHHIDLESSALWAAIRLNYHEQIDGPWILDVGNNDEAENSEILPKQNLEWDSDNDNVLDDEDWAEERYDNIYFLGFHPYKEIVFLMVSFTGVAFHLNTSKVQYLGKLRPKEYYTHSAGVYESFPYTPCLIGELPGTSQETHPDDQQYM